MQKRRTTIVSSLLATFALLVTLVITACGGGGGGGNSYNNTANVNDGSGDTTCITQLDANQKAQLTDYVNKNHDQVNSVSNNSDGTQDVCVLEKSGNGYEEHYYRQQDHFNDYLLYSMMFGYGHQLATIGLLTGDLNVAEAMTLHLLTNINSSGGAYSPYAQQTNGSWARQTNTTTIVNKNITVNNIQYGAAPAKPFSTAKDQAPPSGYAKQVMPKKSDDTATISKNGDIKRGGLGVKTTPSANSPTAKPDFTKNSPPAKSTSGGTGSTGGSKSGGTSGGTSGGKTGGVSIPRK